MVVVLNGIFTIIMTRLKKELVKKTNSATNERIKRIKDQKKVVNSKNNVKISEFHVKRLLESVENDSDASAASFMNDNNNGLQSNVSIFINIKIMDIIKWPLASLVSLIRFIEMYINVTSEKNVKSATI